MEIYRFMDMMEGVVHVVMVIMFQKQHLWLQNHIRGLELQNALGDSRKVLAEEKKARKEMQEQLNAFLSRQGTFQEPNMRCSTSSNPSQEVHTPLVSPQSPYFPPSQRTCEMKSLSSKQTCCLGKNTYRS